ncbi:hypothetical protein K493DRAFT_295900 [Basidiobolus meristosporus CBS 931.73]|uniref:Extracellular membrane protein CFEM domain-containing protein n=1 Tax=Basidiobolus meristosporus CBS 931.73 TaxID=1314790 RepID=A0A1Y1Z8Y5_9FUNG|nr:hypothetical protein K493DRAFT_295900 [Basidiobolus meristosporus CBS 931.73]|eukprot:ORY06564.1 hypothetical protein K493DRAFT_295900 [Basidiobolus meristosporus CBS 931.73]
MFKSSTALLFLFTASLVHGQTMAAASDAQTSLNCAKACNESSPTLQINCIRNCIPGQDQNANNQPTNQGSITVVFTSTVPIEATGTLGPVSIIPATSGEVSIQTINPQSESSFIAASPTSISYDTTITATHTITPSPTGNGGGVHSNTTPEYSSTTALVAPIPTQNNPPNQGQPPFGTDVFSTFEFPSGNGGGAGIMPTQPDQRIPTIASTAIPTEAFPSDSPSVLPSPSSIPSQAPTGQSNSPTSPQSNQPVQATSNPAPTEQPPTISQNSPLPTSDNNNSGERNAPTPIVTAQTSATVSTAGHIRPSAALYSGTNSAPNASLSLLAIIIASLLVSLV